MPWKHFISNPSTFLVDTQYCSYRNNSGKTANSINYNFKIYDQQNSLIDSFGNVIPNFYADAFTNRYVARNKPLTTPNPTLDTVFFTSKYGLKEGTAGDYIP